MFVGFGRAVDFKSDFALLCVFHSVFNEVVKNLSDFVFVAIEMFRLLYNETDDAHLRSLIEKYLPAFDRIEALQKKLHLPFTVVDKDRFVEGILRGRTFRVRYTILQYLYDIGKLESYAERVFDIVMKKHFFGTFKEQFPDWEA